MSTPFREGEAPPDVDRSILLVGLDGKVIGLNRRNGEVLWTNPLVGGGHGEVAIGFRYGALIVSAGGPKIYRLEYETGRTVWEAATSSSGRATLLIEPNVIVVAKAGYLDAYTHGGSSLWVQKLEGMGLGSVALAFPGNIAQADDTGSR